MPSSQSSITGAILNEPVDHAKYAPDDSPPRYHPEFSDILAVGSDFVVTLISTDRVRFRVSANVLKAASGIFAQTLSIPQPAGTTNTDPAVIDNLDEDSRTIEGLLRIITGKEITPSSIDNLDAIEPLLLAADKWDMRGVLSILRVILLMSTKIFAVKPIQLYWLGCRLGWADVTTLAAAHTVYRDLYRGDMQSTLRKMDLGDLLRLMSFHRSRLDTMKSLLETGTLTNHECHWGQSSMETVEWKNLNWTILEKMERVSPSSFIPEETLYELITHLPKCSRNKCPGFTVKLAIQNMRKNWAALPQTI